MVLPGSFSHWQNFILKLQSEIPDFNESLKLTLNTLVSLTPDKTDWTESLMPEYTEKELNLLNKYGRLTNL